METEPGRNCALRKFFPEEIFWSAQFDTLVGSTSSTRAISSSDGNEATFLQDGEFKYKDIKVRNFNLVQSANYHCKLNLR